MTDCTKADDVVPDLRREFEKVVAEAFRGTPAHIALQVADQLCETWKTALAGQLVRVPAIPKVDGEAITADWHEGLSAAEIMSKHDCSRRTAYNYHPRNVRKRAAAGR